MQEPEMQKLYDDLRGAMNGVYENVKSCDRRYNDSFKNENSDVREYMELSLMDHFDRKDAMKKSIKSKMDTTITYLRLTRFCTVLTILMTLISIKIGEGNSFMPFIIIPLLIMEIGILLCITIVSQVLKSEVELILLDTCILAQNVKYQHVGVKHSLLYTRYLVSCIKCIMSHIGTISLEDYATNKLKTHTKESFNCVRETIDLYNDALMQIHTMEGSVFPENDDDDD